MMTGSDFAALSLTQQTTVLVATYLRNAMEDFHVAHLSDDQMRELNP